MKKLLLSTTLFISVSALFAQSAKYAAAMKANLELLKNAKTAQDQLNVSAAFERIANAEKTQWQPYYYAALTRVTSGFMDDKTDKDAIGKKVDELLASGEAINKNADFSMVHYLNETLEMLVDPQSRWQTNGAAMEKYYQQAIAQDSTNPRIYYFKAQNLLHTPENFGGGKTNAKPFAQKSVDLFAQQKPSTDFSPTWGKEEADKLLKECE